MPRYITEDTAAAAEAVAKKVYREMRCGLTARCYLEADGCRYIVDGAYCSRYHRDCAEVHVDEDKEDDNHAQVD